MACWNRPESIPTLLRWTPSKTFCPESAARLSWCAKRMPTAREASLKNIAGRPAAMKLRRSISVDFRRSETRNDGRPVEIKCNRSIEVGPVSQHVGFTQSSKNFFPRMSISIARSHRNHSEPGMHPFQQQRNGGCCAAVVRHLEQVRLRLFFRDLAF